MIAENIANLLLEEFYDYGCLMLYVPPSIGDIMLEWSQLNIPDKVLYTEDDDDSYGRETEAHVTVKYGFVSTYLPEKVYSIVHTTSPFPVTIESVSLFENDKYDVVKCGVQSEGLMTLNRRISESVKTEDTYPEYKPHMTLAYVKKGTCSHLVGKTLQKDKLEFMAYGMRWAGPGKVGERDEEMLLFSKIKQHTDESEKEPFGDSAFPTCADELTKFFRRRKLAKQRNL
jgi:hypothetical protein